MTEPEEKAEEKAEEKPWKEREDSWLCHYCQESVKGVQPPALCPHCKVVRCECGTWLKKWFFCYGCGKIGTEKISRFVRGSSFAACYVQEQWCRENAADPQKTYYFSTGIDGQSVRCKQDIKSERPLTDKELKIIEDWEKP